MDAVGAEKNVALLFEGRMAVGIATPTQRIPYSTKTKKSVANGGGGGFSSGAQNQFLEGPVL